MEQPPQPVVKMTGITKRFPGVTANEDIDFEIHRGQIHALLGENGAGKTTLVNLLCGVFRPDEGEILINGSKASIGSPRDAIELGIGMIHQHFALIPTFDASQNIMLGLKSSKEPLLDTGVVAAKVEDLCQKHGLQIDLDAKILQMSVGEQQRVEIIKTIYRGVDILIMDEPTAVLTPSEVEGLFRFLKSFSAEGHAVVFITHKLEEVMAIADVVTVLRDGRVVGTKSINSTSKSELARMMVGRELHSPSREEEPMIGQTVLELEHISAVNERRLPALKDVTLSVHAGEILGLAGVAGNGQKELAEVIMGLRGVTNGRILVDGDDLTNQRPWVILEHKVAYIPEDRIGMGLISELTVAENAVLSVDLLSACSAGVFGVLLDAKKVEHHASEIVSRFNVKTTSIQAITKTLSGGNLQKLILGRELSRNPKLVIACDPTRGLDIGASEYIRQTLVEKKRDGTAVLLISTDLGEIIATSDRIAVLYDGQIMAIAATRDMTVERLGLLMAGVHDVRAE